MSTVKVLKKASFVINTYPTLSGYKYHVHAIPRIHIVHVILYLYNYIYTYTFKLILYDIINFIMILFYAIPIVYSREECTDYSLSCQVLQIPQTCLYQQSIDGIPWSLMMQASLFLYVIIQQGKLYKSSLLHCVATS